MTATEPRYDGFIVSLRHMGIAKHALCRTSLNGPLDGRCHTEVHVSHPKGYDILLWLFIPLHAVRAAPVDWFVKS